jgi:hypothetical protein
LLGTAAAGAAAGAAAAVAANPLTVTTSAPGPTLPPFDTCTFSTTPLAVDGTSIVALSVSSVASGVSKSTVSPGFTMTSMTDTESKLPMSGTRTSTGPSCGAAAGAAAAAGAFAAAAGAAALTTGLPAAADGASLLTVTTSDPGDTLAPFVTCTFSTMPFAVDGTSIVALSVSSVASGVSTSIASPTFTSTSTTATESKFPRSGTLTSMRELMLSADPVCRRSGRAS